MCVFVPVIIILLSACFLLIAIKKKDKNKITIKKILINVLEPVTGGSKKCIREVFSLLRVKDKPLFKDKVFTALNKHMVSGADVDFYSMLLSDVYCLRF